MWCEAKGKVNSQWLCKDNQFYERAFMRVPSADGRRYAPATERNRAAILAVLTRILPARGRVLEVASGTGEHALFLSQNLPGLIWQPSDADAAMRASIEAWRRSEPSPNLRSPVALDARQAPWLVEAENSETLPAPNLPALQTADPPIIAIANINMIHISPWQSCLGLMAGAGRILPPQGILYLYGPFKREGRHTAPSNAAFDASLRDRNSEWGVRNLEDVAAVAGQHQLTLLETVQMPANNLSVIFQRAGEN